MLSPCMRYTCYLQRVIPMIHKEHSFQISNLLYNTKYYPTINNQSLEVKIAALGNTSDMAVYHYLWVS